MDEFARQALRDNVKRLSSSNFQTSDITIGTRDTVGYDAEVKEFLKAGGMIEAIMRILT